MSKPSSESWAAYYARTGNRPPRRTLLVALNRFAADPGSEGGKFALDLGCGNGRDTIELLRRGWSVLAIDAEPKAIDGLLERPDLPADARLETRTVRFEDALLPTADLVNSSFALSLQPPSAFPGTWSRIVRAVRPGGRIACQLYGMRDEWAGDPTITFFTREGIEELLAPLAWELMDEEETDSVTPRGKPKHWHIFHIVARKS